MGTPRDVDRRYAAYVDVVLAVVLFFLCSGWLLPSTTRTRIVVVAALIFP